MATTQPDMGINRTGIGTSPRLSGDMIDATKEFRPSVSGDERQIAYVRGDYAREADKLGSVPPPPTAKGMAKTALQGLKAARPVQFIDKLGERLGFERSGVRVYEALISKFDHTGGFEGGPERMEVEQILREEFEHFRMLEAAIKKLGGDPTALTLGRGSSDELRPVPRGCAAPGARRQRLLGRARPARRSGRSERHGRGLREGDPRRARPPAQDPDLVGGGAGARRRHERRLRGTVPKRLKPLPASGRRGPREGLRCLAAVVRTQPPGAGDDNAMPGAS